MPASFDKAMEGCQVVMHTASPVLFQVKGVEEAKSKLLDVAVGGVENVLGSCNRVRSVSRVVLTSSVAAGKKTGRRRSANK